MCGDALISDIRQKCTMLSSMAYGSMLETIDRQNTMPRGRLQDMIECTSNGEQMYSFSEKYTAYKMQFHYKSV